MNTDLAHNNNNYSHRRKRAFTLTEIAIVLGIVGLILGAIWVAAAAVYNNLRVSKANTEILSIAQAVRTLYATSSTMTDAAGTDETGSMCKASIFPNDMIPTGGCPAVGAASTLINPWNGTVTVTAQTDTVASDSFGIEFNGITQGACITLVTSITGTGRDPGLYYAGVTAAPKGAVAFGAASPMALPVPASTAAAAGNCGLATTGLSIQLAFQLKG